MAGPVPALPYTLPHCLPCLLPWQDGSVMFEFQHNVIGRTTYAEGVSVCFFALKYYSLKFV